MIEWFILGCVAGMIFKVLVPIPLLDDSIRRGWAWLWSKVSKKAAG